MSDTPSKGVSKVRYRLRTFGTLALTDSDERSVIGKDGHQHRRLALLAMLAAAGAEGRSRDQLLLFFWPDSTQARARHSLEQLLYAIRRSMEQSPFIGTNPVRLNCEVVSSDIADFHAALNRGDLEEAVNQYRGPFLDGFYLGEAPEFEQWVETERASLQRIYSSALERLARDAQARNDTAAAVSWWRKLADTDPVSSKTAAALMRALIDANDHAAALQHAERYETIVRRELGTSAGPQIAEMVAEARSATAAQPILRPRSGRPAPPPVPARDVVEAGDPSPRIASNEASRPSPRRRRLPLVLAALVILTLIATGGWLGSHLRGATRVKPSPSIAVLPFSNVNGNPEDAAFVDGLSEEMISKLAQIRNLRVIGRTSAIAFGKSSLPAPRIADSLGVSNLLEGSVEKAGGQLRVQVRLVDGRDGSTRWSDTYDPNIKDVFAVQSDIATAVARELDLRLSESNLARIERPSTRSIAAYEFFLRGNDQILLRSDSGARQALEYFQNAIALDPRYADAYAGIARMQSRIGFGGDTEMSLSARLALAQQAALKAVALDDLSGDAHANLSVVRRNNYQMKSAEAEMKRAIALDPTNARYHQWMVQLYIFTGRPSEALAEGRRAVELDTLSAASNGEFARALLANGRCDEALQRVKVLKALRPPLLRASSIAAQCYALKQMWPEAIGELRHITARGVNPQTDALLGYMLARGGHREEAKKILAVFLDRSTHNRGRAFDLATVYAGLGDRDQAFAWLNKSIDDRSINVEYVNTVLSGLQTDPRMNAFTARLQAQNR